MKLHEALAGIEHHLWSSEPDVASFLACLVRMHCFESVVEVGVFKGYTACHLVDSLRPGGRYLGIDCEDHRSESTKTFMAERGQVFVLADSREGLARLAPESVDLLFLDGDHSLPYVRDEFLEGVRVLRRGGLICIHDCNTHDVRIWVDYVRRRRGFETVVLGTSAERGLAVVAPRCGTRSAGWWFRLYFRITRNRFAILVRDRLSLSPCTALWQRLRQTGRRPRRNE